MVFFFFFSFWLEYESGGGREGERFFAKVGRRWGGFGLVWLFYRILFSIVVVAVVGFGG